MVRNRTRLRACTYELSTVSSGEYGTFAPLQPVIVAYWATPARLWAWNGSSPVLAAGNSVVFLPHIDDILTSSCDVQNHFGDAKIGLADLRGSPRTGEGTDSSSLWLASWLGWQERWRSQGFC